MTGRIRLETRTILSLALGFVCVLVIGATQGCGGPVEPDTGTQDSGVVDTGTPPVDTGTDTGTGGDSVIPTDTNTPPTDTGTPDTACTPVPISEDDWDCMAHACCTCNIPDPLPPECEGIEEMCRAAYRVDRGANQCTKDLPAGMSRTPFAYASWIGTSVYSCGSGGMAGFVARIDRNGFLGIGSSRFGYDLEGTAMIYEFRCGGTECWANRKVSTMRPYAHLNFISGGNMLTFEAFDTSGNRIGSIVYCNRSR